MAGLICFYLLFQSSIFFKKKKGICLFLKSVTCIQASKFQLILEKAKQPPPRCLFVYLFIFLSDGWVVQSRFYCIMLECAYVCVYKHPYIYTHVHTHKYFIWHPLWILKDTDFMGWGVHYYDNMLVKT